MMWYVRIPWWLVVPYALLWLLFYGIAAIVVLAYLLLELLAWLAERGHAKRIAR